MLRRVLFAAAALTSIAAPAHASVDATVTGVVEDAFLHPMAGATVILHDTNGTTVAHAATGPDGKFTFPGVPFGDYTVEATAPGLAGDHQHLQLAASEVRSVELVLTSTEEVIEVHEDWAVPLPTTATGSVAAVSRQQLQELPGAEDRPVTDVIATQPGFVGDALGNVYARGNHANIQYQVDGIPVPDSVGSLFAASIPVRLIQNLEIYTGGMPAEYGDRLGAVVNMQTRQGLKDADGEATVRYGSYQTVEPAAAYARNLGGVGVFAGGSYQYSQRALDPPSIDPILHDDGYTGRAFLRLDYSPCEANRYELFATYAHNRFQIPLDPAATPYDPNNPRPPDQYGNDAPAYVPRDTNASETEDELFAAFSWLYTFEDKSQLQLAPIYKLSRGVLFSDAQHALGPTADPGATTSDVTRLAQHMGGVGSYTFSLGHHAMKAGVQTDLELGATDFTSYMRDDAAGMLDPTATEAGRDHTSALTTGAYAQDKWTHGPWVLDMGVRADELHVMLAGGKTDDSTGVSPRFGTSFAATKDVVVHAFTGILWQPPAPLDASNAARALGVVPAGENVTYDLKPETDAYGELGVQAKLATQLKTGLVAWARYAWNQLDDTAVGSTSLLSNYNFSRGRAGGLEGTADVRVGPWLSIFANGSLGFAQGKGISSAKYLFDADALAATSWQTLDHAQTLTANAGATVRDGRFSATALAAYGSGLRTGPDNNEHVPGHVRVDTTLAYTFSPSGYPIRVAADVVNLLDSHYAYRISNGFVGSSYAPARSVYLTLSLPLAREPHRAGEK
ncbi:MAG TPA: TonB-dependent receptor [Kofleriaceae bacterium]